MRLYILIFISLLMIACPNNPPKNDSQPVKEEKKKPLVYEYEIINEYKHDTEAFTQGLVYYDGFLYESTGGSRVRGDDFFSSLRKVEIKTGKVLQKYDLPDEFFGEGIVIHKDKIYQLTWKSGVGFIYNLSDFKLLDRFNYSGEGWGLAKDEKHFYQSNGTHIIRVINPENYETIRSIPVFGKDGKPLVNLNELEFIKGEIWANVWYTNKIIRIDPASGQIIGSIDFTKIVDDEIKINQEADVLNGIAYDPESDRLFLTGKKWSRVFEVKLKAVE